MAITLTTDIKSELAYLDALYQRAEKIIINNLEKLGMEAVAYIRDRSGEESWYDKTGNLRSSTGYVISKFGKVLSSSDFSVIGKGTEGSSEGFALATEVARRLSSHEYALIIVAGMYYAAYVEAMDNKDVLASSELYVRDRMPGVIADITEKIFSKL